MMTYLGALVLALMLRFEPKDGATMSRTEVPAGTPGARWEPCFANGFDRLGEKVVPCRPYVARVPVRGAWTVMEPRAARVERLREAAEVLASVAEEQSSLWTWGSTKDFAIALATASMWSTGGREDIEVGRSRGPAGEVCFADATMETARRWADPELKALPNDELALALVGSDPAHLRPCYRLLARAFANARKSSTWLCPERKWRQPIMKSAFSLYGSNRCRTGGKLWWAEGKRYETYSAWVKRDEPLWPSWFDAPAIARD